LIRYFLLSEVYREIFPVVGRKNAIFRPYLRGGSADETDDNAVATAVPTGSAPAAEPQPPRPADNPVYKFLVPGFTVMFVFFLINIMARSFLAERETGTLKRLRLAPIPPISILVGKTLPFFLCSLVQTTVLFLSGKLLFGMPWGPEPVYLIPVILCTSAAATALGLLLATWVQTEQQVSAYGTSLVLILGGLSGCFIPRAWLPATMQTVSLGTPHAWALKAFDAVLTPAAVDGILVLDCCAALLGFAGAFLAAGWWKFRQAC
jgi:ABC-2 type transport system permease protein